RAHGVAVRSSRHPDHAGAVGRRRAPCAAHPAPERRTVVAALLGIGPLLSVAAAPDIDDVAVGPAYVIDLQTQPAPSLPQEVDEEYVGFLDQLQEHLAPPGGLQGQTDAAFAPVGMLHEGLEGAFRRPAGTDPDAALGVASLGV